MKHAICWLSVLFALVVCLPAPARAATIAAGAEHTVVVTPDGHVWTWGRNEFGQLGDGTNVERHVPAQVPGLTNIVAVSASYDHTLALASDGTVWAWGGNWYGQVGDGTTTNQSTPVHLSLTGIVAVGAGREHSVALQSDGTVWTWGDNCCGQLGYSSPGRSVSTPAAVAGWGTVAAVSAGSEHTLALKSNGTVWASGGNFFGELGDGTTTNRFAPVQMFGISTAQRIAAGGVYSLIGLADGTLRGFGYNGFGALGDNTLTATNTSAVTTSGLSSVSQIAPGWYFSAATKSDGTAWAWGQNGYGQIGDGTTTTRLVPTQIVSLSNIAELAIGSDPGHGIAVTSNGVVWTWGFLRPCRSPSAVRTIRGRSRRRRSTSAAVPTPRIKPWRSPARRRMLRFITRWMVRIRPAAIRRSRRVALSPSIRPAP